MNNTLSQELVQHTLSTIGYNKPFQVTFLKKDDTERTLTAMMEEPKKPLNADGPVPVLNINDGGYSSFYTNRVLSIEAEQSEGVTK